MQSYNNCKKKIENKFFFKLTNTREYLFLENNINIDFSCNCMKSH